MKKLNLVAIDDEYPALQLLDFYAQKTNLFNTINLFEDPKQAIKHIQSSNVDMVLLDIKMPHITGIDLIKEIPKKTPCIFFTASPDYALKAYDLDVVDYVLKPFSFERFEKAIHKAIELIKINSDVMQQEFIMVKADYLMHKILLSDIKWIEGFGEYLKLVTTNKTYLVLERLTDFENNNKKLGFVRIHKSYIVIKKHIKTFSSTQVTLYNGQTLPVGRAYKGNVDIT